MKIPKKFQIFGQTYQVKWSDDLPHSNCYGRYIPGENTLELTTKPYPKTLIEQTFIHELLHCILDVLSEDKLYTNEKLIDTVASCLHQVLESGVYED